ncbi:hypothetical protein PF005_g27807 [Phytophthora fragariae]|uniref:Uncharacterized protein n=2 Tax=Phytophthora fragariae TaxID=53985 RepID=A0A6A3VPS6_9STRA|nr:hypothetical protein PF007_g28949 [Phytophthora fragariae]KAE9067241.1 hypothetical protein PF010_g27543 [Phytophthora fragariae]KAE9078858.1 hypothetical protein PF006_g27630 [Phytophthora fragariae]KAE9169812.1 hypothetical protein PF005_g27807 [Phytophthora fragariae]KAE9172087.1 hypothetical protein PF002_g29655 [Phytophthora fragariae]
MRAVRIRGVAVRVVMDYGGSCNGAKVRFSPQKDWPVNASVAKTISAQAQLIFRIPRAISSGTC